MTADENSKLHSKVPKSGSLVVADVSQLQHVIGSLVQAINDCEVNQSRENGKTDKSIKTLDGKFEWLCGEVRKIEGAFRTGVAPAEWSESPRAGSSRGALQRGSISSSMPSSIAALGDARSIDSESPSSRRLDSTHLGVKPATMSHFHALNEQFNAVLTQTAEVKQTSAERFDSIENRVVAIESRLKEHEERVQQRFVDVQEQTAQLIHLRLEKWGKAILTEMSEFKDKTNNGFADVANESKNLEGRLQRLGSTVEGNNTATQGQIERLYKLQRDFAEDVRHSRSQSKVDARKTRDDTRNAVAAAVREARHISSKMEQLTAAVPVDLSTTGSVPVSSLFQPPEARRSGQLRMSLTGGSSESNLPPQRPSSAVPQRIASRPTTPNRPQSARSTLQSDRRNSASGPDDFCIDGQGTSSRAHSPYVTESDLSPTGSDQLIYSSAADIDTISAPVGRVLVRDESDGSIVESKHQPTPNASFRKVRTPPSR
jgi:hypothetical protein